MHMTKVPAKLQGILWSKDVKNIDLNRDAAYIINQVLAFGSLQDIAWLFKTYGRQKVKEVFLMQPIKVYSAPGLNFVKEILLDVSDKEVSDYRYDANLPRYIG